MIVRWSGRQRAHQKGVFPQGRNRFLSWIVNTTNPEMIYKPSSNLLRGFFAVLSTLVCMVSSAQTRKDTSYIGVYLKNLYDFSPSDYSVGADFYLWSNCTDSLRLFDQLEIVNAKKIEEYSSFNDRDINSFVSYKNCKVQLTHNWELNR